MSCLRGVLSRMTGASLSSVGSSWFNVGRIGPGECCSDVGDSRRDRDLSSGSSSF